VKRASTGKLVLNPDPDLVVTRYDEILFLAEDDDTYSPVLPVRANALAAACFHIFSDVFSCVALLLLLLMLLFGVREPLQPANVTPSNPPVPHSPGRGQREVILMCGWRRDTDNLVELLDELVCEHVCSSVGHVTGRIHMLSPYTHPCTVHPSRLSLKASCTF